MNEAVTVAWINACLNVVCWLVIIRAVSMEVTKVSLQRGREAERHTTNQAVRQTHCAFSSLSSLLRVGNDLTSRVKTRANSAPAQKGNIIIITLAV